MDKLNRSWSLMKASWHVLKENKQMLLFSLLSFICSLIVIASFVVPFIAMEYESLERNFLENDTQLYALLFVFYFVLYFVIIFFNTAIVANTLAYMEGREVDFTDGIKTAINRLPQIFNWALVSATVGMILRMIEERAQWLGKIVAGLLGLAFTLISFLVIPILVVEKKGPIEALKESASLFKKTWGEQVGGSMGFGLLFFLLSLPPISFIIIAATTGHGPTILVSVIFFGLYLIILSLVQSTLKAIFQAALYLYARNGEAPRGFDSDLLAGAIPQKKKGFVRTHIID